ncbi:MAG: 1-acyl-sn-glycerol-3-phosphate acyltransferase, partial [Bacteroidales bacterium]|nr:1-acyl-sn-glycerol-3-phosphate acyltransferase [Bacteroidales bacterium]
SDTYFTPSGTRGRFLNRLTKRFSLFFIIRFLHLVFKTSRLAVKGQLDRQAWVISSHSVMKLIENFGGRFHIEGLNNIRKAEGSVVFVSNHMSTLETMVFPCIIASEKEVTFVVKDSLVNFPVFGPIMRARNPIVVSRTNSREDLALVMNQGEKFLEEGTSIIIFPQKTRKVDFVPDEFNSLGVKLAGRAGVQIIPVAIKTDYWGKGKFIKELGPIYPEKTIYMTFEKPMHIQGTGKEEHKKIIEFISSKLEEWSDETTN